jgi:glycosyltransferase involved in cell wall biosynthesis
MKILLCHNYYQQPGGEDQVFADEANLLQSRGHEVVRFTMHNDDINEMNPLSVAAKTLWNSGSYRELSGLLQRERPDVVHFTNTFPLISPSAYYAVKRQGIPVVQSLHNYRLLCPVSTFQRDQQVCEDCLGKMIPWPALLHGCYRSSRLATGAIVAMTTLHRAMRTWQRMVDRFVALSHFSAAKFVEGGLPADKIVVKPNFMSTDPGVGSGKGAFALFVGRLSAEKGIDTLLKTWDQVTDSLPLKILGDGPLASLVEQHAAKDPRVQWLGRKPSAEVLEHLKSATCLVMPSQWYECCPKTLIETLAVGTPAVVTNLGAMAEMIEHESTGLHFERRNATDLARQVHRLASDPELTARMRRAARQRFEDAYTADFNYEQLLGIYEQVCQPKTSSQRATSVATDKALLSTASAPRVTS